MNKSEFSMFPVAVKKIIGLVAYAGCFLALTSLVSCNYFESTQTKLKKAQALYQQDKFNQVIIRTKSILQSDAGSCEARILLGKSQFAKFDLSGAEDTMQKALKNGCKDTAAFFTLMKVYMYRNQFVLAKKLFDDPSMSYASKLPEALLLKGDIYFQGKNKSSAALAYSEYYKITHDDAENCLADVKIKFLDKDYTGAASGASACDKKYGGDKAYNINESGYLRAISLVRENKADEAIGLLEAAIKRKIDSKDPFNKVRAYLLLIRLYLEKNDVEKAGAMADAVMKFIVTPDVYYAKGRKLEKERHIDQAEKQYLASLKLNPEYRPSLLALANIKYLEGNVEQARYYTGRADALIGNNVYTNVLDDRLAIRDLKSGNLDAVINSLSSNKSVRSQYLLALAYAGKGEVQKARNAFAKIKKHLGDKTKSDLLEARLDMALGQIQKAKKILQKYIVYGNPEAVAVLVQIYMSEHNFSAAERLLMSVLHNYPANRNTEFLLIEVYAKSNQKKKLFNLLDSLIVKHPDNDDFKIYRAIMYYKYAQYNDAISQCNNLIHKSPALLRAYIVKANAYVKLEEYENAEQTYSALLKESPKNDYAYLMLALLEKKQSRFSDALGYIDKSLEINPRSMRAIYTKIDILYDLDKHRELEDFASSSAHLFQSTAERQLLLGYAFKRLGDNRRAYDSYKKVQETDNKNVQVALIVYALSVKLHGEKYADKELEKYITSKLNYPDILLVATYFMNEQEYKLAEKYYELFATHNKTNAIVFNNLAWLKLHRGDTSAALNYAKQAIALAPDSGAIMDTMGQVLLKQGAYNKAGSFLLAAHKQLRNNPSIKYHLAQYYYHSNNIDKSKELLDEIVNTEFPEKADAKKLLTRISR